jgi:hypothetical protein
MMKKRLFSAVALVFAVTVSSVYAVEGRILPTALPVQLGDHGVVAHLLYGPIVGEPHLGEFMKLGCGKYEQLAPSLQAKGRDFVSAYLGWHLVMRPTAVMRDIDSIKGDLNRAIEKSPLGNHFVLTLSDLHGAFYAYDDIITLVQGAMDTISGINPNATVTIIFNGDISPKRDPILIADGLDSDGKIVSTTTFREDARLYPGYFCTHLLTPLKQIPAS